MCGKRLLYVCIEFSEETTKILADKIVEFCGSKIDSDKLYKKSHITLCYFADKDYENSFLEFVNESYKSKGLMNKEFNVTIKEIAMDEHCVALTGIEIEPEVKWFPEDKDLHITMMTIDKKPVYSNTLIKEHKQSGQIMTFETPIKITGTLKGVCSK
jgi:hypothetical protein